MLQNVKPNWNETDVNSDAYIQNKPTIQYDWLCLTAKENNSTVRLDKVGEPPAINLEVSTDGVTWYTYVWDSTTGATITLSTNGKVYFRGENETIQQYSYTNMYQFVMSGNIAATGNIMSLLSRTCSKTEVPAGCFSQLFRGCSALTSEDILGGIRHMRSGCELIFGFCTGLTSVEIPNYTTRSTYAFNQAFNGCTNLARVKVGFHTWQLREENNWLNGVAANGVFICPSDLPIVRGTSGIPTGWKVEFESAPQADWDESDSSDPAYILNKPTIPATQIQSDWDESDSSALSFISNKGVATAVSVSDSTYTLNAGTAVPVVAVASALTLSANALTAGKVGYAEIVLDLAQGASVTAGSGLTLVDTPTAGKRNVCVARWQDGACKLYVVITEDLPVDESSSSN